jgi:hypothetical protein
MTGILAAVKAQAFSPLLLMRLQDILLAFRHLPCYPEKNTGGIPYGISKI